MKKLIVICFVIMVPILSQAQQKNFQTLVPSDSIRALADTADMFNKEFLIKMACGDSSAVSKFNLFFGAGTAFRIVRCDSTDRKLFRLNLVNKSWEIQNLGTDEEVDIDITDVDEFIPDKDNKFVSVKMSGYKIIETAHNTYQKKTITYSGTLQQKGPWKNLTRYYVLK